MHSLWSKYLPVIRILLKKARTEEQVLQLNTTDLERAGMARKAGYKFLLILKQGKVENLGQNTPLASSLASVMIGDPATKDLLIDREYHLALSSKSQLTITHVPMHEDVDS